MAGRGRGRGRGLPLSLSYNKAIGGSKPENTLPPTGQPPPLYPPLQFKPLPLLTGKKMTYLLTLKQEIRSSFRESGYFIPPVSMKKDIERYTDKYRQIQAADQIAWDTSLFPKELFEGPRRKKKKVVKKLVKKEDAVKTLNELEAKEETEEKENVGEEEEVENEEEFEEEELEEETDYAANYFDNGETYLDEEDDNMDESYE